MRPARLAVLCSGEGTNLQALLAAIRRGRLRAQIALVISDRPNAVALSRARRAGVPAVCLDPSGSPSRAAYDAALARLIHRAGASWVVLAGFMRILTAAFVRRFPRRILNVHPALLPAFRGAHAVREALAYGVKVTGVTVHLVEPAVDRGPVIAQVPVLVRPGETEQTLRARIHRVEHRLYPRVVQWAVTGRLVVRGRRVAVRGRRVSVRKGRADESGAVGGDCPGDGARDPRLAWPPDGGGGGHDRRRGLWPRGRPQRRLDGHA